MDRYIETKKELESQYENYFPNYSLPKIEPTTTENGEIRTTERSLEAVRRDVLSGDIVVLKDVFETDSLKNIRQDIFSWGQNTDESHISMRESDQSFHRRWKNGNDPRTGRGPDHWLYHNYHFLLEEDRMPSPSLYEKLFPVCEKLRKLQSIMADKDFSFEYSESGPQLRPQLNQYVAGGGYFAMHTHSFKPQKIGLILGFSERGVDFERGGTRFAPHRGPHGIVDTERCHDIGDVTLFRYDTPHEVIPTDPGIEVDWGSERGRWTLILPYLTYD